MAVCSIESGTGHVVSGPISSLEALCMCGGQEALMDEARKLVYNTLEACAEKQSAGLERAEAEHQGMSFPGSCTRRQSAIP